MSNLVCNFVIRQPIHVCEDFHHVNYCYILVYLLKQMCRLVKKIKIFLVDLL